MTTKLYRRKPTVIVAEQITENGILETSAGTFDYKPGDWLCYVDLHVWIVEADVFEKLYEEVQQ